MCARVQCSQCNKPTWSGCGAHVEQVLGDVPPAERCACRETRAAGGRQPLTFMDLWSHVTRGDSDDGAAS